MKTIQMAVMCLVATVIAAHAQTVNTAANQAGIASTTTTTAPQVVLTGPNANIWQWQTVRQLTNGPTLTNTFSYTELASGLNFRNSTNGQWLPSQEIIEVYAGGLIARHGQHQIIFASNLNTPGAIDEINPEGLRLRSNILGLMYVDPTTGQAVQIAEIQDSQAELIASNQVLYPDAFAGVKSDILFSYRKDGTEQDVILREQPPAPEAFGMNSQTTELEVFTEFLSPPTASVADLPDNAQDPEPDQAVSWGGTSLGRGKAFSLNGQDAAVAVTKRYVTVGGRYFLLERVKLPAIQAALSQLPLQASNARRLPGMASTHFQFPKGPQAKSAARLVRLALGARPETGYVLDYVSLNSAYTNYIFQGGNTYYVSGSLNLSGSNVFEGGTVIKYATNAAITGTSGSQMIFRSAPYRPVIFTAKDDNSTGQTISGSTGNPTNYYANPALSLSSLGTFALSEFRIAYANRGLSVSGSSPSLYDAQFVNCATAISDLNGAVAAENVLFSNIKTNFNATSAANSVFVQNATFNNSFDLVNGSFGSTTFYLTNCAFVNATNLSGTIAGGYNGFYQSPTVGSSPVTNTFYPLQRVGAASCYLTNGTAFAAAGTTNVDPVDLIQLASRTTQPPLVYSNTTLTMATTLSPQAQRDTNSSPDFGYHYDSLDFVFGGNVIANSNLTFTAGTAVGWFYQTTGNSYGLSLNNNSTATFAGTATARCDWVRYNTVQEGGDGLWTPQSSLAGLTGGGTLAVQFTTFSVPAAEVAPYSDSGSFLVCRANSCEFYNGGGNCSSSGLTALDATNCLFVNGGPTVTVNYPGPVPVNLTMVNCTAFRGTVGAADISGSPPWYVTIVNCAFDQTGFSFYSSVSNNYYTDYNSFLSGAQKTLYLGGHEVTVSTNYNWQSSWFGNYYLPTNSPDINKGSTTADHVGLYHFTTQVSQIPETNSVVDIGYHYVAASTNGVPLDGNGDGIPDYLEDANGDGLVNNGETNWALAILTQPTNSVADAGTNVALSVIASGIPTIFYQWYFNSVIIPGATNATLTLNAVETNNAGNYYVIVTNNFGSITSATATLTVRTCYWPTSGLQDWWEAEGNAVDSVGGNNGIPEGGTTYTNGIVGQAFSFDGSSGFVATTLLQTNPQSFTMEMWFKTGTSSGGTLMEFGDSQTGTSASYDRNLYMDNAGKLHFGIYNFGFFMANSTVGYNDSNWHYVAATMSSSAGTCLYVDGALVASNPSATLAANFNGWWRIGENNLTNWPSLPASLYFGGLLDEVSLYSRPLSSNEVAAIYAAGPLGKCTSMLPPVIVLQPTNVTVLETSNVTFSVQATGTTPLSYQWYFNGATNSSSLFEATNATLPLTSVQPYSAGNYFVVVTNDFGSVTSSVAGLTVLVPPTITAQPTNESVVVGNAAVFNVSAFGTAPLFYQWYGTNHGLLAGQTNSAYSLVNVPTNNADGYYVVITNFWGSITSSVAWLWVLSPPVITVQPTNQISVQGGTVSFSVGMTGAAPFNCQWYGVNAGLLSGASLHTLTISNVQPTNADSYFVVVSNVFGTATSSNAALSLAAPLTVVITNPIENSVYFSSLTNLALMTSVSDLVGSVTQMQFFQGTTSLGATTNSPYAWVWTNPPDGSYALSAVAWDNTGLAATSVVVHISVFYTNSLALWLTGDGITGLTNNAPVGTWPDNSGRGNNAVQTTTGAKPAWESGVFAGHPAVWFGGSASLNLPNFATTFTQAEALVVLQASVTNQTDNRPLWYLGTYGASTADGYPTLNGHIADAFGSSGTSSGGPFDLGVPSQPLTQLHVYEVVSQTNNWEAWINGLLQFQTAKTWVSFPPDWQNTTGTLGSSLRYFSGYVAEVLVFDRALTTSERFRLNSYLNGKYGLVPSVPATPSNLLAKAVSPTQISLTWDGALNGGATQISIERSISNVNAFTEVAQVSGALSYLDTNLTAGTTYYYRARAINLTQWTPYSTTAQATTLSTGSAVPLASLILWLEADAGIAQSGTNTGVNIWIDQSGTTNNAVQPNAGQQPTWIPSVLGDRPAVQFNGANNFSTGSNSLLTLPNFPAGLTQAEAFVVLQSAGANPNNPQPLWYMGGYNNTVGGYPDQDGQLADGFGSSGLIYLGAPGQPITNFHIYQVVSQTNNWQAWINGILQYQTTNNAVAFPPASIYPTTLGGAHYFFGGYIVEILMFNRGLTTAERAAVNTYLNGKYGLVPSVPATPSNLLAAPASTTQISLTWDGTLNGGATQTSIERSTTNTGGFSEVARVANTLSYIDTNLTAGTTYYYRVRAINLTQWSGYSAIAQATTLAVGPDVPLSSLVLWLKADAGIAEVGTNTPVNIWLDQSGQTNNAVQPIPRNQPTWIPSVQGDRPVLYFNGADDFSTGSNSVLTLPNFASSLTQAEAFVVLQSAGPNPSFPIPLWQMGYDTAYLGFPLSNGYIDDGFGSTGAFAFTPTQPTTNFNVYEVVSQATNWEAWLDGVLQYQTTNTTVYFPTAPLLGQAQYFFKGNVAEVMMFNRGLTAAERTNVNAYLNGKYFKVPPTPTNLTALAISQSQIRLDWTSLNGGASETFIERAASSNGTFSVVGQTNNSLTYIDSNLTNGTTYFYRVRVFNPQYSTPYSAYSSIAQATTFTNGILPFAPVLWLRAGFGVTTNSVGQVSFWADQSGYSNNAAQTATGYQPLWTASALNSSPVVHFDGTNKFLNLPPFMNSATGAEVFVVLRGATNGNGGSNPIWEMGGDNFYYKSYPDGYGHVRDDFGSSMMKNEGVPVESVYQFNIYNVSTRTNYWGSWFDQIQQFETGNNTVSFAAGMTLGTAPSAQYYTDWFTQYTYFSGDIAEILVYNQPLTSAQRQAVSGYLNGFYGLVPSTPATPSNLLAHAISPTQISLTWDEALNAGATQIGIERSTASNGTFQVVAQIPGATSYLDTTNLNPATTYYYRVRAINTTNWSSYSSIAFATTPTVGTNLPLPALALWLKADAGVLQGSSNMPVNVWADQSGNANDAIAVVSPAWVPNAIGDRPVIHFDGGSTFFNLPYFMNGATGAEAFVVLKTETNQPGSSSSLWEMGGDNWNGKGYPNGNNVIQDDFGSGGGYGNGGVHQFATVQPLNQYHIYEVSSQTNDWDAWINGVWQAHVSQNSVSFAATPSLGASVYEQFWVDWVQQTAYFSGDIAEVLVFNRGLTPDERTTVNVYLNGKYGLVPAIPATPSNLVATAVSPMQVALTWNESLNGGATRVSIERLYAGGWAYQEIARVSDTTSYVDTNAPPGTICYYRVRAINTDQWSPYSAPAEATTPVSGNGLPFNALALWLRSDAGFWLNSTSQPVSFWADQSGAQNHATQSFPAAEPVWFSATNGLPAVMQFNGTNSSFNLPYFLNGMAGTEAFVVLETTVTNQVHSLWDFGGYNWLTQKTYPNTDGSISDDFASTTVQYLGVPPQPINQFHVYEVSSQQDNWQAWFNGTSLYQTPETGFNTLGFAAGMYLGTSQYAVDDPGAPFIYYRNSFFAGNIAEVLVFNRSLTTGERTGVNNYLAGKYGLRPVVSIVSPINNTVVPGVTNITITAAASDTAGISQVQFFTGAVSLGIVTNSPYGLTWSNVAFGSYALTAQALDNNGLTFTSAVVNVTVAGIALTAPQTNSVFAAPANLPLSATVVDGAGVSQVQFFAGATVIATLTNAPYSLIWSNVPSGLYALTAAATDDYGMTLTSSVVNVTVDSLPSVTLTNPANSARFIAGTNINLAASASDVFGTVTQVQYFQGTNLLGAATNSPYSVVWSNAPFGAFALTAQATDNYGLTATSSVVNIMVAGIAITNPVNNVVLTAPASVSIGAAVTDNMGITQVQFFQGTTSLGTVTSPPYTINWTSVAAGVYSVTATGTDSGGFVFTSAPVNVIVDTNPNTSDRDGDGVSDWIEYLEGRNPLVAGAVPDTNGIVNLQTYTPLQ